RIGIARAGTATGTGDCVGERTERRIVASTADLETARRAGDRDRVGSKQVKIVGKRVMRPAGTDECCIDQGNGDVHFVRAYLVQGNRAQKRTRVGYWRIGSGDNVQVEDRARARWYTKRNEASDRCHAQNSTFESSHR